MDIGIIMAILKSLSQIKHKPIRTALRMEVDTGLARNACRRMNVQPDPKGSAQIVLIELQKS